MLRSIGHIELFVQGEKEVMKNLSPEGYQYIMNARRVGGQREGERERERERVEMKKYE